MAQLNETLLKEMTNCLVQTFQPEQVTLFGSYAWGTPDDGSDIDLYVVVPESSERPVQRARRARACIGDVRVALDILVRTRTEADKYRHLNASLECQIFEKGRVLYERN
ncbi:MAG TPA: nucleotidyltransferase domain-containing protein [Desulfuromonadales bacterium]|nr:nucleotidyltransferase domain-containing protein [Desulfuromonadales bacterium]